MSEAPLLLPVGLAALWTIVLGLTGATVTDIGSWYRALVKPSWQPPDWLFGPVWSTIFIAAAVAFVQAWRSPAATPATHRLLMGAWFLNAVLNVSWSFLFFRVHRPDWSLREIAPLWLSILAMVIITVWTAPLAGWYLAPYLTWVAFAAILNAAIVRLNGPFGP